MTARIVTPTPRGGGSCVLATLAISGTVLLGTAAGLAAGGIWPQLPVAVRVLAGLTAAVLVAAMLLVGSALADPIPTRQ